MNTDTLIRMANQIGTFFESMPDRQEALEGIATHLRKFWAPRMRQDFLALVDSGASAEIKAIVLEAARRYRNLLD